MLKMTTTRLAGYLLVILTFMLCGAVSTSAQDAAPAATQDTMKAPAPAPNQPQPLPDAEFKTIIESGKPAEWNKIKAMTDGQVKQVMNNKTLKLPVGAVAEEYEVLWLNNLEVLTDEQAKLMAKNEVNLSLNGLKSLDDEQAKSFSTYRGQYMPQAYQNDPTYQNKFGMRAKGVLSLNGLTSLTDDQAKWLGKSKCFELDLNGLTSLDDVQAKALGYFTGAIIQLNGIKTLTDKQANGLAQFMGKIAFVSLDQPSKELFQKYGGVMFGQ